MDLWEQQIELIIEQNGLISFIVHPDYLLDKRARDVYSALLTRLAQLRSQSKMWLPLPRELNDWWRSRNDMRVVEKDGRWQIDGTAAHRARIPYPNLNRHRAPCP